MDYDTQPPEVTTTSTAPASTPAATTALAATGSDFATAVLLAYALVVIGVCALALRVMHNDRRGR